MNSRQELALELMRAPPKSIGYVRRDLYEAADGGYWVTHTGGHDYEQLTKQDVAELLAAGVIKQKRPGCYELAGEASNG